MLWLLCFVVANQVLHLRIHSYWQFIFWPCPAMCESSALRVKCLEKLRFTTNPGVKSDKTWWRRTTQMFWMIDPVAILFYFIFKKMYASHLPYKVTLGGLHVVLLYWCVCLWLQRSMNEDVWSLEVLYSSVVSLDEQTLRHSWNQICKILLVQPVSVVLAFLWSYFLGLSYLVGLTVLEITRRWFKPQRRFKGRLLSYKPQRR